jgi:hypothetical protein
VDTISMFGKPTSIYSHHGCFVNEA